jgi:hypothetical protein
MAAGPVEAGTTEAANVCDVVSTGAVGIKVAVDEGRRLAFGATELLTEPVPTLVLPVALVDPVEKGGVGGTATPPPPGYGYGGVTASVDALTCGAATAGPVLWVRKYQIPPIRATAPPTYAYMGSPNGPVRVRNALTLSTN